MRIPNGARAIVDDAKVYDYLLSPDHPTGRFKARVFGAAGYRRDNWQRLRDDLRALAATIDAEAAQTTEFGQRWTGPGELHGPSGVPLPVLTVWLIPSGGAVPRLVTAYPASTP